MSPVAVVFLDPGGDSCACLVLGGEVLELAQLELHGRVPALGHGIVQFWAGPAHRLFDPDPSAGGLEVLDGVFAALVGVHDHPR